MTISLGVFDGHNAAAALCVDGRVVRAVQEERYTRIKNDCGWPSQAIAAVLAMEGLSASDVNRVDVGSRYVQALAEPRAMKGAFDERYGLHPRRRVGAVLGRLAPYRKMRAGQRMQQRTDAAVASGFEAASVHFHDHHLTHAATAYHGLREDDEPYLVVTLDGGGDGLAGSVWIGRDGELERLSAVPQADSVGEIYAVVTHLLGFMPLEHEYKLMGMAPYCEPEHAERVAAIFRRLLRVDDEGRLQRGVSEPTAYLGERLEGDLRRERFDSICAGLQQFTEEILTGWVGAWARRTGIGRVLAAGGVFMNVKANKSICELDEVTRFDAFPSCGDESLAFGACWLGARAAGDAPQRLLHAYLGPDLTEPECRQVVAEAGERVQVETPRDMADRVAELLAGGEIVARCAGPMEFGARALGSRSILADPVDGDVVRVINRMIKKRDFWMPFAPVVLRQHAGEYFSNPKDLASPYMMNTFDSTSRRSDLMAAVHNADLTARPQLLEPGQNPGYEAILERFAQKTERHVLLNTSFNLHGEPVVCSAADAMRVLLVSGLEHLILGPLLVHKTEAP